MAADFENYKKRAAKEKEEWLKFANEDLLKAILPFVGQSGEGGQPFREVKRRRRVSSTGVKLTIQQLLQALNKFGLSTFESRGKPFDPAIHEAMLVVQTDKEKPDHVMEEFQKGYLLNGSSPEAGHGFRGQTSGRESRKTQ